MSTQETTKTDQNQEPTKLVLPPQFVESILELMPEMGERADEVFDDALEFIHQATRENLPGSEETEWSPLNDKQRRKRIEASATEMDLGEFLRRNVVEQTVTLRKEPEIKVTYRSLRPEDEGALEAWMQTTGNTTQKVYNIMEAGEEVTADQFAELIQGTSAVAPLAELTLGLVNINGEPYGEDVFMTNEEGHPNTIGGTSNSIELETNRT